MFSLFRNRKLQNMDIGFKKGSTKSMLLTQTDRFSHEALFGRERTGKSSIHLLRRITHDLICIARGEKRSIVIVEEKDPLLRGAEKQMNRLGISPAQVTILSACNPEYDSMWNPLLEDQAPIIVSKALVASLSVDENVRRFMERDCLWMVRLAKAFFQENVNLTHLLHLYADPRYLANVVNQIQEIADMNRNPEWSSIVDYFNNYIFLYLNHEDKGVMVPTTYPKGHLFEGLQIVISRHETLNLDLVNLLEEILSNSQLSKTLKNTSSFRIRDVFSSSKIVFVHSSLFKRGELLGNLFLNAFEMELYEKSTFEHPCFLTVDDAGTYDLSPVEFILQRGKKYKIGVSLSFQTYSKSLLSVLNQISLITVLRLGLKGTEELLHEMDRLHSSRQKNCGLI
ncbi:hypothetical protein [Paenibacillus terrae]|uniref:Uncharacterized protein n=1 Tax=Paenibacillus terrae TaxID=159743 RepID=A0A0D7WTJ0_9BACL|nr:hypothetical protein [Paenibacillus terrae]KJD42480.1 hypothetical protein QD47_27995 [Paenibacillus terrae]